MSQDWLQRSKNTLKQLRKLAETTDQDRLELVRVIHFTFNALNQSLAGWIQWIHNPEIMSNFTQEELEEVMKTITAIVEQFLEHDIKITEEGIRKGLAKQKPTREGAHFII